MKKFTLMSGGSVWIDLKAITAVAAHRKEKPEVFVYVGNSCYVVSTGDTGSEAFADDLAAEVDAARIDNLNFIIEKNNAEVENNVRKICEDFGITEKTAAKSGVTIETKSFKGAPLPDKDGLIYTDKKFSFPLAHLNALYIKNGYEVHAIFKGVDDVIFRFETQHRDTPANSLDYLTKLASYTTLTKVNDQLYVDSDAVNDVIVERNVNNHFDVKLVVGFYKIFVDCEFNASDAFDLADDAKSKFKI